ncbi:MerR family transcriptional regulator [Streptomyces sp. SID13031]|uniref:MerR family transcriptional regulator n=1 Tax=Streptomyces sp. SID13031 TaxID=2706046 RepID=UPI0013CA7F76|nr:MerR family transcriptional regulator [Streptomyces sp. SID13031]NEA33891.1 MerR family transcriptional regulator [Streptomyces sp. SID13031]
MTASVTIGEFSRLTHLSVKTLHHYHEIGLLAPARIDASSGYRRYETAQVPVAQLIRRLRDLQMPLAQVRSVVEAPDVQTRDQTLRLHLDQMERELAQTRDVVASLRSMLTLPAGELAVEYRFVPSFRAYSVTDRVHRDAIDEWCGTTFGLLGEIAGTYGISAASGATYGDEFFTEDLGEVVAFLPVAPDQPAIDRVGLTDLPASYFAITRHDGSFKDFDRTYGALGSHVAEYCEIAPGPIRELYLVGPGDGVDETEFRTEICWPIQRIPHLKG